MRIDPKIKKKNLDAREQHKVRYYQGMREVLEDTQNNLSALFAHFKQIPPAFSLIEQEIKGNLNKIDALLKSSQTENLFETQVLVDSHFDYIYRITLEILTFNIHLLIPYLPDELDTFDKIEKAIRQVRTSIKTRFYLHLEETKSNN